jgi:hypothetical protein
MKTKLIRFCCIATLLIGSSFILGENLFAFEYKFAEQQGDGPRSVTAAGTIPLAADRVAERFAGKTDLGEIVPDLLFTFFIAEQTAIEFEREPPVSMLEMFDRAEAGKVVVDRQKTLYLLALFDFPPPISNRWAVLKLEGENSGSDVILRFAKFSGDLFRCQGEIRLTPVGPGDSQLSITLLLVPEQGSKRDFEQFIVKTFLPNLYKGLVSFLKTSTE